MVENYESRDLGHNSAKPRNLVTNTKLSREMELCLGWRSWEEQMYYATCHSFINHGCKLCFARATRKIVINPSRSLMMFICLGLIHPVKWEYIYRPS